MSIIISYNWNSAKEIAKKNLSHIYQNWENQHQISCLFKKSTSNNFFIKESQHQIISSNSIPSISSDIGYVGISKECEVTIWEISEFDLGDTHFIYFINDVIHRRLLLHLLEWWSIVFRSLVGISEKLDFQRLQDCARCQSGYESTGWRRRESYFLKDCGMHGCWSSWFVKFLSALVIIRGTLQKVNWIRIKEWRFYRPQLFIHMSFFGFNTSKKHLNSHICTLYNNAGL